MNVDIMKSMKTTILSNAFALFLLMDSFGNIPIYLSILKGIDKKKHVQIIFRELLIALILFILFALFGNNFLSFLGISTKSMQLSGGIVLFILGMRMIFPAQGGQTYGLDGEPFIFPLAVPLVSGPASLAAVMIYSHQDVSSLRLITSILIAWAATTTILMLAGKLSDWIDPRGLSALERLMGLILIMIAIEMVLKGWAQADFSVSTLTR